MKKLLLLLIFITTTLSSCITINNNSATSEDSYLNPTTFILVRHAEKEKDKDNPRLTEEGSHRAKKLSSMLIDMPIDAIYSSNYKRTLETAEPTAKEHGLDVKIYDPGALEEAYKMMLTNHIGGTILVVGHSNTTPNFVNLLASEEIAPPIDESEYDNLYFVNYFDADNCDVKRLRF